jgi:hypothetical protein
VTRDKAPVIQAAPAVAGTAVALPQAKAAVVPIKPPPADLHFPGGHVNSPEPGRVSVTIDPTNPRTLAGSENHEFTEALLDRVLQTTVRPTNDPEAATKRIAVAATALAAFKPADEIEAMLAAQAVAMHHMAMECFRRATLPDQHPDIASKLRKDGANLCRGMVDMLDGLDRKRGKGPQVVRVERVVVHEGGQAIVGNVQSAASKVGEG